MQILIMVFLRDGPVQHALHKPGDGRNRAAQFMADIGDKLPAARFILRDALGHGIERPAQFRGFRHAALILHTHGEISLRDGPCRPGQCPQRLHQRADKEEHRNARRKRDQGHHRQHRPEEFRDAALHRLCLCADQNSAKHLFTADKRDPDGKGRGSVDEHTHGNLFA